MQIDLTIADVRNITEAVRTAVPPEFALDISSLEEADGDLEEVSQTVHDAEEDAATFFDAIRRLIFGFGAVVVVASITGVLALARPVRLSLIHISEPTRPY